MVVVIILLVLASTAFAGEDAQLLCFGAKWCQPCREMQPTLDRLTREGFPIRKVDVEQLSDLANRYQVKAVPACVLVDRQGRKVDQILQATNYETLRRLFAHYRITPMNTTVRGQSPALNPPSSPNTVVPIQPTVPGGSATQAQSLASTVRLRVEDEAGHSFGTGTVVDVHGQEGLVLTCGHIFRSSAGKGRILIERFDSQTAQPTTGTLISYDIDRDVALVSMKLTRPIEVAALAPLQYKAQQGETIYSIGCNQGATPTVVTGQVNQIDKYLGPPNITASGRPVVGRSGGGLFNAKGELIGVCSAADPEIDEGLYAALPRVYYELDRNGLSFVYQNQDQTPLAEVASVGELPNLQGPDFAATRPPSTLPAESNALGTELQEPIRSPSPTTAIATPSRFASEPKQKLKSRELVCILKSEDGTEGEAYVIEDPSDILLEYLKREAKLKK